VESRYTCLIVDDEPPARTELRALTEGVPWLLVLGEASNGPEALEKIDGLRPDLVFLDIQMPGFTGLDLLARATHRPMVIFTTAFADHAVSAFGLDALDYLLKPFGEERFGQAVARAKRRLDAEVRHRHGELILDGFPVRRVFVKDRGRLFPLEPSAIIRFQADDDYVRIHTAQREFLVYGPLKELEARLGSPTFVRVHRSHLVNLDHIRSLVPHTGGRFRVELSSGDSVVASRRQSRRLREIIL
jgi:two-component system LytT family response regulator